MLKLRIDEDEYNKFQEVCDKKGKNMSEVIRSFISSYNKSENIILLDVSSDKLKECNELCQEKKIKFSDLVKFLLDKAIKNKDKLKFN